MPVSNGEVHTGPTVALVTGPNQGIGLQVATEPAGHGMCVPVDSREVVRAALSGPDGPTRKFTGREDRTVPW